MPRLQRHSRGQEDSCAARFEWPSGSQRSREAAQPHVQCDNTDDAAYRQSRRASSPERMPLRQQLLFMQETKGKDWRALVQGGSNRFPTAANQPFARCGEVADLCLAPHYFRRKQRLARKPKYLLGPAIA